MKNEMIENHLSNESESSLKNNDNFKNDEFLNLQNEYESNLNLETEILYYIEQEFPDYYHKDIVKPKQKKIDHLSNLLNEYKEIGKNQEKHNLKWAFKKVNSDFNFEELQKVQPKPGDCFVAYDDVVSFVSERSKAKINNFSRRLTFLSLSIDFLDIFISVVLIVLFYFLTELGNKIFNTIILGALFILFIAFTRVFLDRWAIGPFVDSYGWKLFNKTIQHARNESIRLNGIYLVLIESINRKETVEARFELIRKQKQKLARSGTMINVPNLNSPEPAN